MEFEDFLSLQLDAVKLNLLQRYRHEAVSAQKSGSHVIPWGPKSVGSEAALGAAVLRTPPPSRKKASLFVDSTRGTLLPAVQESRASTRSCEFDTGSVDLAPPSPTSPSGPKSSDWGSFAMRLMDKCADENGMAESARYMEILEPWQFGQVVVPGTPLGNVTTKRRSSIKYAAVKTDDELEVGHCVIHPHSSFRLAWCIFGCIVTCADVIALPLQLFDYLSFWSYISFCVWLFDLVLNFFTGVEVEGTLELKKRRIARVYLKTWLPIDISIWLADFVLLLTESDSLAATKVLRALRCLRFIRLLRVSKLRHSVHFLGQYVHSMYAQLVGRMFASMFMTLVLMHYAALAFLYMGNALHNVFPGSEGATTWMEAMQLVNYPFHLQYVTDLHWCLCQITPATNDVRPVNPVERLYAIVLVLLSMLLFSSFLSSLNASMTSLRMLAKSETRNEVTLRRFFTERRLPKELMMQVKVVFDRSFGSRKKLLESEVHILQQVPRSCRILVHREMFKPYIEQLPWVTPPMLSNLEFITKLCDSAMQEVNLKPSHSVFLFGDTCAGPVLLATGAMDYFIGTMNPLLDDGEDVPSMHWLSEMSLFAEWTHKGSLVSHDSSYSIRLQASSFARLARDEGGNLFKTLQMYAQLSVARLEDLNASSLSDMPLCELGSELRQQADGLLLALSSRGGRTLRATVGVAADSVRT